MKPQAPGGRGAATRTSVVFIPIAIVALTFASYLAGWAIGVPVLVPVLNTAPILPFMIASLARGHTDVAIARMLIWAAALAVGSTLLSYWRPDQTGALFINGDAYRREMLTWILTGVGREGEPSQFIPRHALHVAVFCALSLLSGSVLSMPVGAVLMNYMGHYVGALAAMSASPALTIVTAWAPWVIVRVVSFVTLGVVLAGPVLSRVAGFQFRLRDHGRLIAWALAGLVADVLMKGFLAYTWRGWLRALVWP
jgi:hypothetical protein